MSERTPCCQESWDEGWFQGFRNAGELLGFSADSHSSFRAAMDERIADAVQEERKRIAAWLRSVVTLTADDGDLTNHLADAVERGNHLRGDDE